MRFTVVTALATAAVVGTPALAATAATGGGSATFLAIAAIVWFAADKIIDLLPIRDNTTVGIIRTILRSIFGTANR